MSPRFHLAGVPVRVHLLFAVTAFLTGMSRLGEPARLLSWMVVVFVGVLVHELGHALAFRGYGCRPRITLHGLGGTTTGEGAGRLTHRQDAWVSLAGPGAGFLLGGLVHAARTWTPLGQVGGFGRGVVEDVLWVNVGWAVLNLLPLLPLDGGHVLAASLRARDNPAAERRVHLVSLGVAAGVLAVAVWREALWLGVLALLLGGMNLVQYRRLGTERPLLRRLGPPPPRRRASPEEAAAPVERLLTELRLPSRLAPDARRAPPPAAPREPAPPDAPHDSGLVGELLLGGGLAPLAIRPLQQAFRARPSPETAHPLATALLAAGRYPALATLLSDETAAHVGNTTLEVIAARATEAGQDALAARARGLLQRRTSRTDEPG